MCCISVGTEMRLFWFSSGPLFSFDVHDDIRLVNDATVEKDEVRWFLTISMMSDPHFGQEPPKLTGRDLLVCFYVMFLGQVDVKLDGILVENQHLCFRICCFLQCLEQLSLSKIWCHKPWTISDMFFLSSLTCLSLRTQTQCFLAYFSKLFVFLRLSSLMQEKWCWGAGMKKTNTSSLPAAGSLTIPKKNGTNTL